MKWILPSEKNHENRFMLRIEQAEQDLTDALDLLDELWEKLSPEDFPTAERITKFLSTFKQSK